MVDFDVVTFGSGVVDVFVSTKVGEINVRSATRRSGARGLKSVKKLDLDVGGKYLIEGLRFDVGGGGTNTAVAFARFGLKTGCICGVGRDANGREVLKCLEKEKVEFLGKVGRGKTGYSVVVDSEKHDRTILTYKGESNEVSFGDVKGFGSRWLYFSSLLGKSFEAQKRLAREFVGGGGELAFNPSSYSIESQDIGELLKACSVLILNREEAVALLRRYGKKKRRVRDKDLLEGLFKLGPKVVVVTDREKKVLAFDGHSEYSILPNKRKKVVERTGAGDAFAAGFVAGMIKGWAIEECLRLGNEESEAVLGHYGAKNNLLKRRLK